MMYYILVILFCAIVNADPTIYLKEEFSTADSLKKWVESTYKGSDQGKFIYTAGKFYDDMDKDKGIQTSQDAKFYGISYKLEKPFSNKDRTLVVQFQVKHEQTIDCGGGYIKLMGKDLDQKNFHGETPYEIMFGPDICGIGTKKVHVIFNYNGKNHLIKKDIPCKDDEFSHLYTLILKSDNTYEVLIDLEKVESGNFEDDWDFLQPKKINDPNAQKPADWVDEPKMPDENDKKPEDWDKPKTIPDPKAKKPEDWDDEMDGEWEAPKIDNPEYRGDWKPKEIDNPNYKGPWVHPEIDNPDYKPDNTLYLRGEIGYVGFDLWQVKSGTIFDNILITDEPEYAKDFGLKTWRVTADGEKAMKNKLDEEERKRTEEEDKKKEATKQAEPKVEEQDKAPESEEAESKDKVDHTEL
uniref:Calreticulin n=1 Tax=Schmidtea mediterranea TaxID=79327 RepID=I1ZIA6_SCHMD|nr:calreticulin-1 [Schmidtea mediterranea]